MPAAAVTSRLMLLLLHISDRLNAILHNRTFQELREIMESIGLHPRDLDLCSSSTDHIRVILVHRLLECLLAILDLDHGGDELFAVADCVVCTLATI